MHCSFEIDIVKGFNFCPWNEILTSMVCWHYEKCVVLDGNLLHKDDNMMVER